MEDKRVEEYHIEGRNPVIEALRAGRDFDKIYIQKECKDGPISTIVKLAKNKGIPLKFLQKERLDEISTGKHQGVIGFCAAYNYSSVEDILDKAAEKNEDPFIILLDGIEDPHNLGAIIRTANLVGAHGVIIEKNRAAGLSPTAVKASAGAVNFTPVAKVTNMTRTIEQLKEKGIWIIGSAMDGDVMYRVNLKGPIALVIGNEGSGISRLVRENCDIMASIPLVGDIDSLNASVATGILAYEIFRQRMG